MFNSSPASPRACKEEADIAGVLFYPLYLAATTLRAMFVRQWPAVCLREQSCPEHSCKDTHAVVFPPLRRTYALNLTTSPYTTFDLQTRCRKNKDPLTIILPALAHIK